ncbi:hypothetical protein JCM8547_001714 [Rhodosporidiobolus lusitaniae]
MQRRRSSAQYDPERAEGPPTPISGNQARLNGDRQLAPTDQREGAGAGQYRAGSPIKFYDDEVAKMHHELDQRAGDDRLAARRALRTPTRRRKKGVTFTGFLLRVAIFYVVIGHYLICPSDDPREYAVCRGLDRVSSRLESFKPVVRPYYLTAERKIAPYVALVQAHTKPYTNKVRPHFERVDRLVTPHLSKVEHAYHSQVYPRLVAGIHRSRAFTRPYVEAVKKQYTKTLAPSFEHYGADLEKWWATKVEPHLSFAHSTASRHLNTVSSTVSPVWTHGAPLAQHHYRTHVLPFSRKAYSTSRRTYLSHVHPRAVATGKHSAHFYRTRIAPALQRFYSRFIDPQLSKIGERIFEYKSKKATQEAMERVEKKAQEIAEEHGEDDFEDFIKELRNSKDATAAPIETPALPEDIPPAYSSSVPPPPPSPEDAAVLRAEKRAALEALQTAFEQEITALGQAEQALLVERLAAIRSHALEDVPARFDVSLERLDEEGDKMVGRLGKYFARVAGDEKTTAEEKVEDAEFLSKKAVEKVRKMAEAVKEEVEQYRQEVEQKEQSAVEKAQQAVTDLVNKAQGELGIGWTWLEDVTAKDWQRYHSLTHAEKNLHKSFASLKSGAIKDPSLASLKPYALLDDYSKQPDLLVSTFETILNKIKIKGQKEIKGEWAGVVPEAQKAYEAVSDKFGGVVADLKASASSVVGAEAKPTNVQQSLSSLAKAAQASVSSVAQEAISALPTIEAHQEWAAAAKAAYGDASQNVLRAAGIEPSPTDLKQTATSLARAASASAASAYAEASQSALRAVGQEPSPTDLAQSLTSIGNVASASAAAAYSQVLSDYPSSISSALAAATQAVDAAADDAFSSASSLAASAASVVSSLAAPAATLINAAPIVDVLEGAKEKANEFFGDVSQGALAAVGVEPSPTDSSQSVTSVGKAAVSSAQSAASQITEAVKPLSSSFSASASSVSAQVSSSAAGKHGVKASVESVVSRGSKAVHDATRTTAEGVRGTVASVSSAASKSASSLSSVASASASSLSFAASISASSASKAAASSASSVSKAAAASASSLSKSPSSLAAPHPSYTKSRAAASVSRGTASVKSAASSLSSIVAATPAAEGVKEKVKSVVEKVSSAASPAKEYEARKTLESVVSATEKVKEKVREGVRHVEL